MKKIVEDYLNSAIPEKLNDNIKTELRAELESHIYDKAEFYMEIGYEEEAAFEKAVNEMGETEPVREQFESVYKDSTLKAWLCFGGILISNLVALFNGFAYFTVDTMLPPSSFMVLLSSLFAGVVLVLVFHSKNHKLENRLFAIGGATGLMLLFSILTNAIYQPMFYGLGYNVAYAINALSGKIYDEIPGVAAPAGAFLFLFLIIFLCVKKLKRKVNIKALSFALVLFAAANMTVFYNAEIDYDYTPEIYTEEEVVKYYPYYSAISEEMTFAQADAYLKKNGFVDREGCLKIASILDEDYGEPHYYPDALEETRAILKDNLEDKEGEIYCTKEDAEQPYAIWDYIILSKDGSTKVYSFDPPYEVAEKKTDDALKCKATFLNLREGDSKSDVDEIIDILGFRTYEKNVNQNGRMITEYRLELESDEDIPTWKNFFGISYHQSCWIDIYLKFENGALTDGVMEYDFHDSKTKESTFEVYPLIR